MRRIILTIGISLIGLFVWWQYFSSWEPWGVAGMAFIVAGTAVLVSSIAIDALEETKGAS
jgi:hypothetical protein